MSLLYSKTQFLKLFKAFATVENFLKKFCRKTKYMILLTHNNFKLLTSRSNRPNKTSNIFAVFMFLSKYFLRNKFPIRKTFPVKQY